MTYLSCKNNRQTYADGDGVILIDDWHDTNTEQFSESIHGIQVASSLSNN